MKVKAKINFSSTTHGNVVAGQILELGSNIAFQMRDADMVEFVEGKKLEKKPEPSQSLQAAPASVEIKPENLKPLETKTESKSSESTRATKPRSATTSTQPTGDGGKSTPKRRGRPRKSLAQTPTRSKDSDSKE